MKLNEIKDVQCKAQHGKWSDWNKTEDSNCAFNENTETWTKKATRTCSPEPLFGGICQGTYSRLSNRHRLLNKSSLNFHITTLIHFYINLGIVVVF